MNPTNTPPLSFAALEAQLASCMLADRHTLRRKLREAANQPAQLNEIAQRIGRSSTRYLARQQALPRPEFPPELPVSTRKDEIAAAITRHQVVIVCGETGSGKTTQLPKICLELGRGVAGLIGHTQPRRIAARSVASRIAQELKSPLLSLIHISEPTRRTPISYAVFCLKK